MQLKLAGTIEFRSISNLSSLVFLFLRSQSFTSSPIFLFYKLNSDRTRVVQEKDENQSWIVHWQRQLGFNCSNYGLAHQITWMSTT